MELFISLSWSFNHEKRFGIEPNSHQASSMVVKKKLVIVKSNATDKEYASAARAIKFNTSVYPRMHNTSTSTCTVAQCAFSSPRMNGLMLCTFCVLFYFFAERTFCLIVALEWWFKDQRKHFHVGGVLIIIIKVDLKRANRHSVDFTHHQYHD